MSNFTLTRQDRCDSCPAAAQAVAQSVGGNILMFCGHHLAKNHQKLLAVGFSIIEPKSDEEVSV